MSLEGSETNHGDYYSLLNVPHNATRKQISDAYKKIALQCHPDRCKDPNQASELTKYFDECTQAYDALCDPVTRALYDLVIGVTEDTPEEKRRINNMKKEDARRACSVLEDSISSVINEERQRNGLVILDARYGRLEIDPARPLTPPKSRLTQWIDVTIPVQSMVEESQLILKGGGSKSWLEGFYDPSEDLDPSENILWIQYLFLGQKHQVYVADDEELQMPMSSHLITAREAQLERELGELETRENERKKSRRRWALASLVLAIGGAMLYRNRDSPSIAPWLNRLTSLIGGNSGQRPQQQQRQQQQLP